MADRLAEAIQALPIPPFPRRTLTLGCGDFPERYALQRGEDWLHFGIDWQAPPQLDPPFYSIQADATQLPFRITFSLILMRHPNVAHHPERWQKVIQQIPTYLVSNGIFLLSAYEWADYQVLKKSLNLKTLPLNLKSPISLDGSDRFIWAFRG